MNDVRIYKPTKSAMQSGHRNTRDWVLEFEPGAAKVTDPLMGWTGSTDTKGQVRIPFPSKEDAVDFAKKNGLAYRVQKSRTRHIKLKNYADNFGFRRPF